MKVKGKEREVQFEDSEVGEFDGGSPSWGSLTPDMQDADLPEAKEEPEVVLASPLGNNRKRDYNKAEMSEGPEPEKKRRVSKARNGR